jgi:hypothetical protein
MIFSCPCPSCGTKKEYVSEESGQLGHCLGCGSQFVLAKQNFKVFKHIAVATLAVTLGIGVAGGRSFWKNFHRAQVRHQFHERERERRDAELLEKLGIDPTVIDDDDKENR